jgi:hypothetical protein
MRISLGICLLLASYCFAVAQADGTHTLGEIKQWQFQVRDGKVGVKLTAALEKPSGRTVLTLKPEGELKPTVSEEAELLRRVLRDMPSLGYDPSNLEMISTWLQGSGFEEGVEQAVQHSGRWKACLGRKYCHAAEGVADQYMLSINAFNEMDAVLHEYGLKRKAARLDDMAVAMKSGRVLCDGLIVIPLDKKK